MAYKYKEKSCRYCGELFDPASGVQQVCFHPRCRHQRQLDKWTRKREKYRRKIYADNMARYYRTKQSRRIHNIGLGQKLIEAWSCKCGCGIWIPAMTIKGKANPLHTGHYWKGRKMPEWVCLKWRDRQLKLMKNPDYVKARIQRLVQRPNGLESMLIAIIKDYSIPLDYVGDGQFLIGRFNPDFVNIKERKIVEIYGSYWHNKPKALIKDAFRKGEYSKAGYSLLIFWERDMRRMSIQQIATTLLEFIDNKKEVVIRSS